METREDAKLAHMRMVVVAVAVIVGGCGIVPVNDMTEPDMARQPIPPLNLDLSEIPDLAQHAPLGYGYCGAGVVADAHGLCAADAFCVADVGGDGFVNERCCLRSGASMSGCSQDADCCSNGGYDGKCSPTGQCCYVDADGVEFC